MKSKEQLIEMANRVAGKRWYERNEELSEKELRNRIANALKDKRSDWASFLKYKHKPIIEEFCNELRKERYYSEVTPFELFRNTPDILYDYDTDDDYDHHRWCSYFSATKKVGDKIFGYQWANANGDNSLEDAGFDIDNVWETMYVIDQKDNITVDQMLSWMIKTYVLEEDRAGYREFIKESIINNE